MHVFLKMSQSLQLPQILYFVLSVPSCTFCFGSHCFFNVLFVPFVIVSSGNTNQGDFSLGEVLSFIEKFIKVVVVDVKLQLTAHILYFYMLSDVIFFSSHILLVFVTVLDFEAVLFKRKKNGGNDLTDNFQESWKSSLCCPG